MNHFYGYYIFVTLICSINCYTDPITDNDIFGKGTESQFVTKDPVSRINEIYP